MLKPMDQAMQWRMAFVQFLSGDERNAYTHSLPPYMLLRQETIFGKQPLKKTLPLLIVRPLILQPLPVILHATNLLAVIIRYGI